MTAAVVRIAPGGLDDARVQALVAFHRQQAHANTPTENCFALAADDLAQPEMRFFTAWQGDRPVGIAALRLMGGGEGEVKSMRVLPDVLGQGIGRRLLERVLAEARAAGITTLRLETGTHSDFDAACGLYRSVGFTDAPAYGDYRPSPHNQFMALRL